MVVHTIATCQLTIIWNSIQEHSEDNYKFSSAEKRALNPSRGRGFGFKVTGMIKGFVSVLNVRFRDLFGLQTLASIYWAA